MKKQFLLMMFGIMFLFSLNFINAQPLTVVSNFPEGYTIVESQHDYLIQYQDYQYNFFVYNSSTGNLLDNSSIVCNFFLANQSGETILINNATYFSDGHWGIDILGSNFSDVGSYPYGVNCENDFGGALTGIFEVEEQDKTGVFAIDLNSNSNIVIMVILILLGIGAFIIKRYEITSIIFIITGFFMLLNDTNTIASVVVISLGVITAFIGGDD